MAPVSSARSRRLFWSATSPVAAGAGLVFVVVGVSMITEGALDWFGWFAALLAVLGGVLIATAGFRRNVAWVTDSGVRLFPFAGRRIVPVAAIETVAVHPGAKALLASWAVVLVMRDRRPGEDGHTPLLLDCFSSRGAFRSASAMAAILGVSAREECEHDPDAEPDESY